MGGRLATIGIFLGLLYAYTGVGLFRLQIHENESFLARAANQVELAGLLRSSRGGIYMTDKFGGKFLAAMNRDYPAIIAAPDSIVNREEIIETFSDFLNIEKDRLNNILSREGSRYQIIKSRVSDDEVQAVKSVAFPGIYIEQQEFRFYPFQTLAAHVIGFLGYNEDGEQAGRYGIEELYDERLRGVPGRMEKNQYIRPQFGHDIFLTIDKNIQNRAEEILFALVEGYRAEGGTIIVMEPQTGIIRAMASFPTFNPNAYKDFAISRFLNPAIQAVYEPGSIVKVLTMAAGIDAGAITPHTTYTDYGEVRVRDRVIKNWDNKAHGVLTMTEALEGSINTGMVFAESRMGHQTFYDYLKKFGLGEKTGITLPGEITGSLRPLESKPFSDVQYATASFGQGIAVTPLQMIQAIGALANNGVMMMPIILQDDTPKIVRRVISEESARHVREMMTSTVEKAKVAVIPGYYVAGKTGTAQVPDLRYGGYTLDVINTYVGFAPATNPRALVLVKLDKPAGAPLAGSTVVPAFRELMQYILNYYNVPPDNISMR